MRRNRGSNQIVVQQRRGPGLLGTMARTAVIAGTATAVSNKVSGASHAAAAQQAAASQQQVEAAVQQALAQQPPAPPAPAPASGGDRIAQLQQLAELKQQGILTDEEFAAEKARILAS
jgi:hypothetical protein